MTDSNKTEEQNAVCPHGCEPDECETCEEECRRKARDAREERIADMWCAWAEALKSQLEHGRG